MRFTGPLNTLWFRRSTVAVLAYALALVSVSATTESNAVSGDAQAVSDNSVELPKLRQVLMQVTAYCPCTKCCGPKAQGITASGRDVTYNDGRFVAADRGVPFGTKLIIPGYHSAEPVEVIDRGGAIKGNKLDVFFPTHQEALEWGRQNVLVTIVE